MTKKGGLDKVSKPSDAALTSVSEDIVPEVLLGMMKQSQARPRSQLLALYERRTDGGTNDETYLKFKTIDVLFGYGEEKDSAKKLDALAAALAPAEFRKWMRSTFEKLKQSGEPPRLEFAQRMLAKYVDVLPTSFDRKDDLKFFMHTVLRVHATDIAPVCLEYVRRLPNRDKSENIALARLQPGISQTSLAGNKYVPILTAMLQANVPLEEAAHAALRKWALDTLA